MRRLAEIVAFLGLSAAVHAGVVAGLGGSLGGTEGQGASGAAQVSLQAAPDSLAALAERWTTPPAPVVAPTPLPVPEIAADLPHIRPETGVSSLSRPPMPDAPAPEATLARPETPPAFPRPSAPAMPAAPALPQVDASAPQAARVDTAPARAAAPALASPTPPDQPVPDTAPPPPVDSALATDRSPRPPQRPAAQAAPASAPQPARIAEGQGAGTTQGSAAPAAAPALSAGQVQSLMSQWGGQIMARIERARPRVRGEGQVLLALRVARDGQLAALSVSRSSGDPALDAAALDAVRRAGRFPAAPDGLTEASYGFSLPIRFR